VQSHTTGWPLAAGQQQPPIGRCIRPGQTGELALKTLEAETKAQGTGVFEEELADDLDLFA
jgi:hypothetical protein